MPAFTCVEEFKSAIIKHDPVEFVENFVIGTETEHFCGDNLAYVTEVVEEQLGIKLEVNEVNVVGSAKLGFAAHDKIRDRTIVASAYRSFGEESDIDVSICSPSLFRTLWHEISSYYHKQSYLPFRHKKFGDYLAYGWLRADQLPTEANHYLLKCNNLRLVKSKIRRDRDRGHPMVELGVFYDITHLKMYQIRSIAKCKEKLEAPL